MYNNRWTIEEMFKTLKLTTNMDHMNEISYDRICKTVYCHSIIAKLTYLFKNYYEHLIKDNKQKNENRIKKVNQSCLSEYIFDSGILYEIFSGKTNMISLNNLNKNIKYTSSRINISNPIHCKRSSYLSYFKYNNRKKRNESENNKNENNKNENKNKKTIETFPKDTIIDFTDG